MTAKLNRAAGPDYTFECMGSVWLCRPQNHTAREHLRMNTSEEAQWFGNALAVEPRYVADLAQQLDGNGFSVQAPVVAWLPRAGGER